MSEALQKYRIVVDEDGSVDYEEDPDGVMMFAAEVEAVLKDVREGCQAQLEIHGECLCSACELHKRLLAKLEVQP